MIKVTLDKQLEEKRKQNQQQFQEKKSFDRNLLDNI